MLTDIWKVPSTLSESKSAYNALPKNELVKKKIEEEIEFKNKKIVEFKKQRD